MIDHVLANVRQRRLILELSRNDFRARYTGSLLGTAWAFVQPVLTILLYLFIYQVGFKSAQHGDVPFVLWLVVGIAPWFFFIDGMTGTTHALLEYSFLVKKVLFDVSIVPTIKLVSAAWIHAIIWGVVLVIVALSGFPPRATWLLVPYWFFAMCALLSGLGLVTAAITPFFRDMAQIVAVGLQFAFWLTPVMWSLSNVPERFRPFLELNPVYYVIEGLRDTLLLGRPFWAQPMLSAWFWAFVVVTNLLGWAIFRRLRPHFPDVL